ncbi:MAG TPA: transporter substrate-binding domain-containing protein [Hyphomicrobiales bacterium]|nr:transporter substrate-binding domain-containing protein [Hyphomicrobiales bacterium]
MKIAVFSRVRAGAQILAALLAIVVSGAALQAQDSPKVRGLELQTGPKPGWSWLPQLRILTEADYPPFNYYDEEARLVGFNVDLARAICRELSINCEISTAEWSALIPALKNNEADAVIASLSITKKALAEVDFTDRYYTTPARFVARADSPLKTISAAALNGLKVAVVKGSSHEAFLRDFFPGAKLVLYPAPAEARAALKNGEADLLFGDGISLMFWIQGTDSDRCCEFKGDGYTEARYFGDGAGIAIKKGNTRLREVLDYALERVKASGRYEELMLRYFPLPLY